MPSLFLSWDQVGEDLVVLYLSVVVLLCCCVVVAQYGAGIWSFLLPVFGDRFFLFLSTKIK